MSEFGILLSPYKPTEVIRSSVYNTIKRACEEWPENTALVDTNTDKSLTYKELLNLVERVAYNLSLYGVHKQDVFAVSSHNCMEYVVVFLAAVRLGAVPCLISNMATKDEIVRYAKLCSAKFLYIDEKRAETAVEIAKDAAIEHVFTSEEKAECVAWPLLEKSIPDGETVPVLPDMWDEVFLLLLSSGTTGPPKVVEQSHAAFVRGISTLCKDLKIAGNTTILYQPLAHIFGIGVTLGSLFMGSTLVLMSRFNPELYIKLLTTYRISHLQLVPPILVLLCKSPHVTSETLKHVKSIVIGAAATSAELETLARTKLNPDVVFRNTYAMTEGGVLTIIPTPEDNIPGTAPVGSVGVPFPGCKAKICDLTTGDILGPGEPGEICVYTPNHMVSYRNNPEMTAATLDEEGYIHTGDVARYDENGYIFIVDRVKELIKYKGYQVSPSELEGVILEHPLVADVGVTSIPCETAGELPQAWVVRKEPSLTEKMLQDYVTEKSAPYKHLRGGVKFVDAIPKSPTGKIMRRQMKEIAAEEAAKEKNS